MVKLKKWSRIEDKPTCLFSTTHRDMVGGGDLYAHQIAMCLDKLTAMRYFGGQINPRMKDFHWITPSFKHTSIVSESDIFVWCSHFSIHRPIGKQRNILIVMFPNKEFDPTGYDTILTCSHFSAEWVWKYWKKKAVVVYPWCDPKIYKPSKERTPKKKILSVGRFFLEQNGHTKHQDILLEAFNELLLLDPSWTLSLAGSCLSQNDSTFANHCRDIAEQKGISSRVSFHHNAKKEDLLKLYQTHHFYWHANGYKSTNPYETEHFGLVFVEAMMCGSVVYPYRDGGWTEFGGNSWISTKGLANVTQADWWKLHSSTTGDFQEKRSSERTFASFIFCEERMNEGINGLLFK